MMKSSRGKVSGSPTSVGLILLGPQMSVQNFMPIQLRSYFSLEQSGELTKGSVIPTCVVIQI